MANIIQAFPKGSGGGGGHTILDSSGTAAAQEKNLKITGLSITDNPVDESTDLAPAGLNQDSIDDITGADLPSTIIVGSGFNYSTAEQVVGRWVDGKPIYQKTWVNLDTDYYLNTNIWVDISIVSVNNVDRLIDCKVISNQHGDTPSADYLFNFAFGFNRTNNCLLLQNTRSINNSLGVDGRTYDITIQYTKTTD